MNHKFWLVWNPDGSMPRQRHTSYDSAVREASRLAERHGPQQFFVLEAVSVAKRTEPVTVTPLLLDDDGIPF